MKRTTPAMALALLSVVAGCAALPPAVPAGQDAGMRLEAGLSALDAADYAGAFEELVWVLAHCPGREASIHAGAALAALELDPRNPTGRPRVGMELLSELILGEGTPEWLRPLATTTYVLGLGLGAPAAREPADEVARVRADVTDTVRPDDVAATGQRPAGGQAEPTPAQVAARATVGPVVGCGPRLAGTPRGPDALPVLPGPSLMELLADAETERDRTEERAEAMDTELARLRQELAETRAELERIRRTLRP